MIKKWCIYKHTNKINGKCYIGQTCRNLSKRFGKNGYNYAPYSQVKFYNAIQKYGWDNFDHEILESDIPTLEEAYEKEKYYIKLYDSFKNGYNATSGGKGTPDKILSAEERRKISERFRKIRGPLHHNYGKRGPETSMWGKHMSEESNEKRRKKMLGRKMSLEFREKMRLYNLGKKHAPHTEKWKKERSEAMRGAKNPMYGKNTNNHATREVLQLTLDNILIKEWPSIKQASEETKIRHIGECCRYDGYHKTAGGYKWRYKNE